MNVQFISFSGNNITKLPPLSNDLKHLYCSNNRLTLLPDHLPDSLTWLSCCNNRLTRLPLQLPNTLTTLSCENNRLTMLVNKWNNLNRLYCSNNYLVKFPKQLPNDLVYLNSRNNPFLFTLKTYFKWVYEQYIYDNDNEYSYNNYKILVVLQRKIQSKVQRKVQRKLSNYFCRDINRLCDKY